MSSKMYELLDTESLIKEVELRPGLYSREVKFSDSREEKRALWEEVASALYPKSWKKMNQDQKAIKLDTVQRRWKSLRTCFTREFKRQKDPKWIYGVAYKRRKYVYYDQLSFLKSEFDNEDEETPHDIDLPEKTEADNTQVTLDTDINEIPISEVMPAMKGKGTPVEQSIHKPPVAPVAPVLKAPPPQPSSPVPPVATQPKPEQSINDAGCTHFALSLVPLLKMLPLWARIDAQISILTVMKQFHRKDNYDNVYLSEDEIDTRKRRLDDRDRQISPRISYSKRNKILHIEIKSEAESDEE